MKTVESNSEVWGAFRFSVIGGLLAAPPERGELAERLNELSKRTYQHPIKEEPVKFAYSTIEDWYYIARNAKGSIVEALSKKVKATSGSFPSVLAFIRMAICEQYKSHPSWSCQLHYDNLKSVHKDTPSYSSIRRFMQTSGMQRKKRIRAKDREKLLEVMDRQGKKEIRSYEAEFVGGLWHLDFHECSRQVLTEEGKWARAYLLCIMDDRSRLGCHAQWYLSEGVRCLVHGFIQALLKRGLPRSLMSDNGSAMIAGEFKSGLRRLDIDLEYTLPYSPHQNGKQENFWAQVEGRLIDMLEGVKDLSLAQLNRATVAWLEMEYNRKVHSEIGQSPLECYLNTKDVLRLCPEQDILKDAFRQDVKRIQRRSDGTCSLESRRYEIPSLYGQIKEIFVRYARWDLTNVHLIDKKSGKALIRLYPLDKQKNADGKRRSIVTESQKTEKPGEIAPLLKNLMEQYAKTGLPYAYIPETGEDHE